MTLNRYATLQCDRCKLAETLQPSASKADGWVLCGSHAHLCPTCATEVFGALAQQICFRVTPTKVLDV